MYVYLWNHQTTVNEFYFNLNIKRDLDQMLNFPLGAKFRYVSMTKYNASFANVTSNSVICSKNRRTLRVYHNTNNTPHNARGTFLSNSIGVCVPIIATDTLHHGGPQIFASAIVVSFHRV